MKTETNTQPTPGTWTRLPEPTQNSHNATETFASTIAAAIALAAGITASAAFFTNF